MTTDTGAGAQTGLGSDGGSGSGDDAGAKERAKHVAGVAAGEARGVASEATGHARDLVGEARGHLQGQFDEQGHVAKDQLAGTLGTLSDDLRSMAENSSGLAGNLAHEVAERACTLSRHLDGREPSELLDDVRRLARQRPGTFLLGALAAGVVVGRLARGAKDAIDAAEGETDTRVTDPPQTTLGTPGTTAVHADPPVGDPLTTTGYPAPASDVGSALPETGPSTGYTS